MGNHLCGKPSAKGQPTRPTHPFIPAGSINKKQAPIRCLPPRLVVAPSGERLQNKRQAWCNLQVKLCNPCLSALCVFSTWRYIKHCTYYLTVCCPAWQTALPCLSMWFVNVLTINKYIIILYLLTPASWMWSAFWVPSVLDSRHASLWYLDVKFYATWNVTIKTEKVL